MDNIAATNNGGLIYIAWGGLAVLIIIIPFLIIYVYLSKGSNKYGKDKKRIERLMAKLEKLSSESDSANEDDLPYNLRKRDFRKKPNKKGRTKKDRETIHKMKTHKERSSFQPNNQELRKARSPSFFERQNARKYPIVRICFTGGPCSGRTTAMAHCADQLRQIGIKVYIVPETFALLNKGAATIPKFEKDQTRVIKFKISLLKLQMALEDILMDIGGDFYPEDKVVIFCDMGTMDASVSLDKNIWNALLDETGWTDIQLRDKRYDMIIHMVTAADGAEEYFKPDNPEHRSDNIEEALTIDRRTRQAWVGHPSF